MALTPRARNVLQWLVQRVARPRGGANPIKASLSSDRSLQLDCVKAELLVIADQHAAVNTFPGLVHTARHTTGVGNTRSGRSQPLMRRRLTKVGLATGVKS